MPEDPRSLETEYNGGDKLIATVPTASPFKIHKSLAMLGLRPLESLERANDPKTLID